MKIACIMMQKNETLLLDPWIRYHASLLGSEHIYVYDNGSSDTAVIQTLRDAEKSGVNVFWDYTKQDDFFNKGENISGLIRRLDEERPHDFYFPLDCDEFLACSLPGGTLSCRKQDILDALQPHLVAPDVLVISHKYWNNILYPDSYTITTSSKKCFFARGACRSLDHGFHNARSKRGDSEVKTAIVYVEFHYRPYAFQRQASKQKLIGLVGDFSRRSLQAYARKRSHNFHCAEELLQSKYEFMKDFLDTSKLVAAPALLATFDALGIEHAQLFESRSGIQRVSGRSTLLLRHGVSRSLAFLTDRLHRLHRGVVGGLKWAYRRLAGTLRG